MASANCHGYQLLPQDILIAVKRQQAVLQQAVLTRMSVMNHPFSVSSTLHLPSRPRYLTNSVSVSQMVEFMWMWLRSAMNSLYTTLAATRLAGWLRGGREGEWKAARAQAAEQREHTTR